MLHADNLVNMKKILKLLDKYEQLYRFNREISMPAGTHDFTILFLELYSDESGGVNRWKKWGMKSKEIFEFRDFADLKSKLKKRIKKLERKIDGYKANSTASA